MFEIKLKPAVGLALLGALAALAACAVLASGASAATGFTFCYPKTGGAFEGGACRIKGPAHNYAIATPVAKGHESVLSFCEESAGGAYQTAYCTKAGSPNAWELKSSTTAAPKLVGTSGPTTLVWHLSGVASEIQCGSGAFRTGVEPEGVTSSGTIELKSCSVLKPSKCEVKSPGENPGTILAYVGGSLEESAGKVVYVFKGSGSEGKLMELEFSGSSCAISGDEFPIEGHQTCEFDAQSAVLQEAHELICKTSGSSLTDGTEKTTYEGTTTVKSEGGYAWSPGASGAAPPASKYKILYCHEVGLEEGPFGNGTCSEAGGKGEYLSAWPGTATTLFACHKVASGKGAYEDSGCSKPGGAKDWELEETAWPVKLEGQTGTVVVASTIAGLTAKITCTKGSLAAQPGAEGETQEAKLELSSCTLTAPPKCTVKEPIVGNLTGRLEESGGKLVDKMVGSGEKEAIAKMSIEGSGCSSKGAQLTLKGTQTFEFDANVGKFQEKHELIGKTSGSTLKLGEVGFEKATFEGTTTVTAPGDEAWLAN